ncbi:MAG: SDR family oxidoreductase [Anaerolineales bacterium]
MPEQPEISPTTPFALVTGASSGIGEAIVRDLVKHGWNVFGSVRSTADASRLADIYPERVFPVMLDVTKQSDIRRAFEQIEAVTRGQGLQGLVNNAGTAVVGPIEFLASEDLRRQFEVNFLGQIAVTQAAMPFIRTGRGRVVNMSSISGRVAMPFFTPYAASKFALEAFSDSLRVELRPWGIHVALIEPGAVDTPIWEKSLQASEQRLDSLPEAAHTLYEEDINRMRANAVNSGRHGVNPQRVADAVYHALTASHPKTRYYVGRGVSLAAFFAKHAPDWLRDWVVAKMTGFDRQD